MGGSLALKAFHLEEGKRWWLRGRFGRGPLDQGMAKALPGGRVRQSEQALLYYPLLMPNPIRRPPDPLKSPMKVPIPRRHMEYWQSDSMLEAKVPADYAVSNVDPNPPQAVLRPAELRQLLSTLDCDPTGARLVGFLEYQMALKHLETLLGMTTPAEQEAINEMVADDDRFAIHSAISRQYDEIAQTSVLTLSLPKTEDPRAKGEYERRGLTWVMALARLELGAMVAARIPGMMLGPNFYQETRTKVDSDTVVQLFVPSTTDPGLGRRAKVSLQAGEEILEINSGRLRFRDPVLRPFAAWPPTAFERSAFQELLWDGARQHYYSFRTKFLATYGGRRNIILLDRLLVRLTVAVEMVRAYREYSGAVLTAAQRRELAEWLSLLENARERVARALYPQDSLVTPVGVNRGTGTAEQQVEQARERLRRRQQVRDMGGVAVPSNP